MHLFSKIKNRTPQWFLPLLLILLGAFLRLFYLGAIPGGVHQDECFVALNSFDLYHEATDSGGRHLPIYMADWGDGHSAMYSWLLVPLLAFNGGIPTLFLSRLPQALVATITLWCIYCLIKRMFGRSAGLWALFALTICPWHIMMARWGLDCNLAPGFLIFSLYFFIRALDDQRFLLVAALFYGLSLYCYAVIWPIVPLMLLLQIIYGLYHRKLTINKWSIGAALLLFVLALPLILFVLVNSEIIPEIYLPFMSIPQSSGYRGGEVSLNLSQMWINFKTTARLFLLQDTGSPYDVIEPWGLFYDLGRVFIVIGAICLIYRVVKSLLQKEFAYEYFLFVQVLCGGFVGLIVSIRVHQINAFFIPLVLCEAYGLWKIINFIKSKHAQLGSVVQGIIISVFLVCLVLFQRDYYTDYKELTDAYFQAGVKECVEYAVEQCEATGIDTITAEKATQWPRLLLYTETLASEYFTNVVYDVPPAPAQFTTHGLTINTRINYDTITTESIYIIYYTDAELFSVDFNLTPFYDWYVAVPKNI